MAIVVKEAVVVAEEGRYGPVVVHALESLVVVVHVNIEAPVFGLFVLSPLKALSTR
jgi:hypothetical protein